MKALVLQKTVEEDSEIQCSPLLVNMRNRKTKPLFLIRVSEISGIAFLDYIIRRYPSRSVVARGLKPLYLKPLPASIQFEEMVKAVVLGAAGMPILLDPLDFS
jgi:hypothetical protein